MELKYCTVKRPTRPNAGSGKVRVRLYFLLQAPPPDSQASAPKEPVSPAGLVHCFLRTGRFEEGKERIADCTTLV